MPPSSVLHAALMGSGGTCRDRASDQAYSRAVDVPVTQHRRAWPILRRRRSPRHVTWLVLCLAGSLLLRSPDVSPAFLGRSKGSAVLFRYQDYELRRLEAFPWLAVQKVPSRPVSSVSLVTSQEGSLDDFRGYPFLTANSGTLSVNVARPVNSKLSLSYEDPPVGKGSESDGRGQVGTFEYEQRVPGIGDVSSKVKNTGEWALGLRRGLGALGKFSGTWDSQSDWSMALAQTYPAVIGVTPSASYGATQDGMHMNVALDASPGKNTHAQYSVRNLPGKYEPEDLVHSGKLALAAAGGAHVLEAEGTYSQKFPKNPMRGSLSYTANTRPGQLTASVDSDRYRLRGRSRGVELAASIGRSPIKDRARPKEIELKTSKLSAAASFGEGKPRLRVNTAL